MPGTFSRHRQVAIPTCITALRDPRAVMHAGIANKWFSLKSVAGKTLPAFPAHAQPAILRIWKKAHSQNDPCLTKHNEAQTVCIII